MNTDRLTRCKLVNRLSEISSRQSELINLQSEVIETLSKVLLQYVTMEELESLKNPHGNIRDTKDNPKEDIL